mgnify:CR=1 FL=1
MQQKLNLCCQSITVVANPIYQKQTQVRAKQSTQYKLRINVQQVIINQTKDTNVVYIIHWSVALIRLSIRDKFMTTKT